MRLSFLLNLLTLLAIGLGSSRLSAQNLTTGPAHTVFLLGNTAQTAAPMARLRQLRRVLEQQKGPFTVVEVIWWAMRAWRPTAIRP